MMKKIMSVIMSLVMSVSVVSAFSVPVGAASRTINIDTVADIQPVCGRQATCQTDLQKCVVDVMNAHNPYDVEWDYGKDYKKLVKKCDWSKVFDAKYYMKAFPMLALQYNYDEKLLLEHFQTVGIHEGRQGNSKFNVQAYIENGGKSLKKYFAKNYEGYYFYYMLEYASEKKVNTTSIKKGTPDKQIDCIITKHQLEDFKNVDKYRDEVKAPTMYWCGEAAAYANFRAYINVKDDWDAHDWALKNTAQMNKYLSLDNDGYEVCCENNLTYKSNNYSSLVASVDTIYYKNSPSHYEAIIDKNYRYIGTSNLYKDINEQKNCNVKKKYMMSHFQIFCVDAD